MSPALYRQRALFEQMARHAMPPALHRQWALFNRHAKRCHRHYTGNGHCSTGTSSDATGTIPAMGIIQLARQAMPSALSRQSPSDGTGTIPAMGIIQPARQAMSPALHRQWALFNRRSRETPLVRAKRCFRYYTGNRHYSTGTIGRPPQSCQAISPALCRQ